MELATLEELNLVFEKLKPVLEGFLNQKTELEKEITQNGTVPDHIRTECPYNSTLMVRRFDKAEQSTYSLFMKWIEENEITRIAYDGKQVLISSKVEKVEGRRGEPLLLAGSTSLEREYKYDFELEKLRKLQFSALITKYPFSGVSRCDHLQDATTTQTSIPVVVTRQLRSMEATDRQRVNLEALCLDCDRRIEHVCTESGVRKDGFVYRTHHNHDHILLRLLLRSNNIAFEETEARSYYDRTGFEFFIPNFQALITNTKKKELEDVVSKVKPGILVCPGEKSDIVSLLGLNANVILFDDSPEAVQRYAIYDKTKQIEQDMEKCCNHIVDNLDSYIEQMRGKEHDRIIESLARVGRELGFLSQREVAIKGARVDLVWLNRDGTVFAAVEVETGSTMKKDVITTWELEPKLAIIVGHYLTDRPLTDMLEYVLLKNMPHKLLLINNTTKKAYLIVKQQLLKQFDLNVSQKGVSDVAEL